MNFKLLPLSLILTATIWHWEEIETNGASEYFFCDTSVTQRSPTWYSRRKRKMAR